MKSRLVRRLMLSAGITAIVGASVCAMTGTSSAASTPQPSRGAVRLVRAEVVVGKTVDGVSKVIRVEPATAKVVRVGETTSAGPADSTAGPSEVCMAYMGTGLTTVNSGGWVAVDFTFSSAPFIVGSMFNETVKTFYAEESEWQSGVDVDVSALDNGNGETLSGYLGVDFFTSDGSC